MEEILGRKSLFRGRAFATFSTTEKALASCCMLCRPGAVDQQNLTSNESISVLRTVLQRHIKKPIDKTSLIHDCLFFG